MVLRGATKGRSDLQSELKANGNAIHSQESVIHSQASIFGKHFTVSQSISRWSMAQSRRMPGIKGPSSYCWGHWGQKATNMGSATQYFLCPLLTVFFSWCCHSLNPLICTCVCVNIQLCDCLFTLCTSCDSNVNSVRTEICANVVCCLECPWIILGTVANTESRL